MNLFHRSLFLCNLLAALGLLTIFAQPQSVNAAQPACPVPALSRIQRHRVNRGETLESIARRYNLSPSTIVSLNPVASRGVVAEGNILQIPPFDGFVVPVPSGQTWRQVAARYKVRPDTLFEVNGCQENAKLLFIPGTIQQQGRILTESPSPTNQSTSISGYPLANPATVGLGFGWQLNPITNEIFFHSGIDLLAPTGTPVEAIAPGIVVFAKEQGSYGKVVIINHVGGMQSRYAQLDSIQVTLGQKINQGVVIGTIGTSGQPTTRQPHLHFEIRSQEALGWTAKNPKDYLAR
ncbi:MAG TPA: M23 family metallopeptidase [Nostocaceae cyanobacterium]|nr:M23 family metallopeptidase [Nostocaceae cyanobacterium]